MDAGEVDLATQSKPFVRRFTSHHFSFHLKQNLYGRIVRRLSREFWARMPRIDPVKELSPLKLTLGSQWWSVKSETYRNAMQALASNPKIEKYFRKIECGDESFFGTIFHDVARNHADNGTTFVKWINRGRPKAMGPAELAEAQVINHYLFIRKITVADYKALQAALRS